MSAITMKYPIVLRIIQGYIEASQPDLGIRMIRGQVVDVVHKREQLGTIILDVWEEISKRVAAGKANNPPSTPSSLGMERVALLTTGEVAALLGVHKQTVRRMCVAGQLQCVTTPGGHRKVKITDPLLAEFINPTYRK